MRGDDTAGPSWPLSAKLYWRESTQEWVLELSGSIGETYFCCRHAQSANLSAEDVPGLPELYRKADAVNDLLEALQLVRETCSMSNMTRHTIYAAIAKATGE